MQREEEPFLVKNREESTINPPPKLSQHYEEPFFSVNQPQSLSSKPKLESNNAEVSRIEALTSLVSNNHQEDANNSNLLSPSKLSLSRISNSSEGKKKVKRLKSVTKKGNFETPKKNDVQNEYYPMKEN